VSGFVGFAIAIGVGLVLFGVLYVLALAVGLGRCLTCRKLILPMEAYCSLHGSDSNSEEPTR
jgi:hypothetical protein